MVYNYDNGNYSETDDFNYNYSRKLYYEKMIRDTVDEFSIDNYEVFQIIRQ